MERAELSDWLRLSLTPGIGNGAARSLLAAFGLPQAIFSQSHATLAQVVNAAQATALATAPDELEPLLAATWDWLQAPGVDDQGPPCKRVLTLADSLYPQALLQMADPPPLLYVQGDPRVVSGARDAADILQASIERGIAIVGSRNPTPQGAANARQFARTLRQAGLTVVSGLALGVDGAAHEGALEGLDTADGQLPTIAVVGTGLDRVYPRAHRDLARRIARHGLIVSEYHVGTPPLAPNFPKRNRIIAALSQGTLVVEAALQSGSLITAREATEQGKDVFAIPGSIHSTQSRGCHALIRQGAKLVESAQDILEELRWPVRGGTVAAPPAGRAASAEGPLLQALGFDPVSLDALQARTGIPTAQLQAQLMEAELQGQVARLPGGLFQRRALG